MTRLTKSPLVRSVLLAIAIPSIALGLILAPIIWRAYKNERLYSLGQEYFAQRDFRAAFTTLDSLSGFRDSNYIANVARLEYLYELLTYPDPYFDEAMEILAQLPMGFYNTKLLADFIPIYQQTVELYILEKYVEAHKYSKSFFDTQVDLNIEDLLTGIRAGAFCVHLRGGNLEDAVDVLLLMKGSETLELLFSGSATIASDVV